MVYTWWSTRGSDHKNSLKLIYLLLYFSLTLSVAQATIYRRMSSWCQRIMNRKVCGRRRSWCNLSYYTGIWLEALRKNTKTSVKICCLRSEFWTRDLQSTAQTVAITPTQSLLVATDGLKRNRKLPQHTRKHACLERNEMNCDRTLQTVNKRRHPNMQAT
jgi:hypothetical protein